MITPVVVERLGPDELRALAGPLCVLYERCFTEPSWYESAEQVAGYATVLAGHLTSRGCPGWSSVPGDALDTSENQLTRPVPAHRGAATPGMSVLPAPTDGPLPPPVCTPDRTGYRTRGPNSNQTRIDVLLPFPFDGGIAAESTHSDDQVNVDGTILAGRDSGSAWLVLPYGDWLLGSTDDARRRFQ